MTQAKDLPVLPDVTTFEPDMDSYMEPTENGRWVRSDDYYSKVEAYGQQCAAHAREVALSEAIDAALSKYKGTK